MGFWDRLFKPKWKSEKLQTFKELGTYQSIFSSFGGDIYKSDLVRSCIRPLCEISSKANAKCKVKDIEDLLNGSPNEFMSGRDFLWKTRAYVEVKNTAFILINRDDRLKVIGLYPVPYSSFEVMQTARGDIYIEFSFNSSMMNKMVAPLADLAIIRKDYLYSDISGEDNSPLGPLLDLIQTTNQGVANAVKATANLRGILKSTKAMLSDEDVKKQKDRFVKDYLSLENEGGIASLDSTQEFSPITMNPTVASTGQMKEFRENVYRYFGVNDRIVMTDFSESQFEYFYEARIEPFLVALSVELTRKIFTAREITFGNRIIYEANKMQFASTSTKLSFVQLVDRGAMTPNEWRAIFNLDPIEGGDNPIRRLDTEEVNEHNDEAEDEAQKKEEEEQEKSDDSDESEEE